MTETILHHLTVCTDGGRLRSVGVRFAQGVIHAVRIINSEAPAHFFRRFGNALAFCIGDLDRWPSELHIEVATDHEADSAVGLPLHDISSSVDRGDAVWAPPWMRLAVVEEWLIKHAPAKAIEHDARYFYGIERWFNERLVRERGLPTDKSVPHASGATSILSEVGMRVSLLIARLRERQRGGDCGPIVDSVGTESLIDPIMADLARSRFGESSGATRGRQALETFARFGAGELALEVHGPSPASGLSSRISNGAPNGSLVFAFAEYALLMQEIARREEDRLLWRDLLPGCLLAAELYLLVYALHTRDGYIIKRDYAGSSHAAAPRLRYVLNKTCENLIDKYYNCFLHKDAYEEGLVQRHLASILQEAFRPIVVSPLRVSRSGRACPAIHPTRSKNHVVFPQLPTLDVRMQRWWGHAAREPDSIVHIYTGDKSGICPGRRGKGYNDCSVFVE